MSLPARSELMLPGASPYDSILMPSPVFLSCLCHPQFHALGSRGTSCRRTPDYCLMPVTCQFYRDAAHNWDPCAWSAITLGTYSVCTYLMYSVLPTYLCRYVAAFVGAVDHCWEPGSVLGLTARNKEQATRNPFGQHQAPYPRGSWA